MMGQTVQEEGPPAMGAGPQVTSTQEAIMAATIRLLLRRSSDGISMGDIATEAGVSRRTVFNQFASKEALIEQSLARVWSRIGIAEITGTLDATADPRATMTRIGMAITAFWLEGDAIAIARMAIRESFILPESSLHYLDQGKRPVTQAIIRYVETLVAAGRIQTDDAGLAARQFIGLINEPLVFLQVLGQPETHSEAHVRKVVEEAVEIFFLRYPLQERAGPPTDGPAR
jgi:AcrR family transcriptional regulator